MTATTQQRFVWWLIVAWFTFTLVGVCVRGYTALAVVQTFLLAAALVMLARSYRRPAQR